MFGKKKENTYLRDIVIAYKRAFGTPEGKMVLCDLMDRYHILNRHDGDPMKEGERGVVLDILKKLRVDVAELDKIIKGEGEA